MPTITLDPARHVYQVDGRRVPGVTEILRKVGQISLDWVTEVGLARGTHVHQAIAFDHEGDLDETSLSPEVLEKVEAFRKWKTAMGVEIIEFERHVFHPHLHYCGTLDLIAKVGGDTFVVDLKTGKPEKWHRLQLAGYALAYEAELGPRAERLPRAALYLLEGEYRWKPCRNPRDYDGWKAALTLANWTEVEE